jgi:hypothetical protein
MQPMSGYKVGYIIGRMAFNSQTMEAATHLMAVVQLQELQEGGTLAPCPHRFNQADFELFSVGAKPNPDIGC